MKYVDLSRSLHYFVNKYPEVKDYLIGQGLTQVEDPKLLDSIGKNITLEILVQSKGINKELFVKQLEEIISESRANVDTTLFEKEKNTKATIRIQGILPCPVRIPLLEGFEGWLEETTPEYRASVDYELKAASMGVDWRKESLEKNSSD